MIKIIILTRIIMNTSQTYNKFKIWHNKTNKLIKMMSNSKLTTILILIIKIIKIRILIKIKSCKITKMNKKIYLNSKLTILVLIIKIIKILIKIISCKITKMNKKIYLIMNRKNVRVKVKIKLKKAWKIKF